MPTEVKDDAKLLQQVDLDDNKTAVPRTHVDDEYAQAGVVDPKVMITTSHNPSTKLVQFAKVGGVVQHVTLVQGLGSP